MWFLCMVSWIWIRPPSFDPLILRQASMDFFFGGAVGPFGGLSLFLVHLVLTVGPFHRKINRFPEKKRPPKHWRESFGGRIRDALAAFDKTLPRFWRPKRWREAFCAALAWGIGESWCQSSCTSHCRMRGLDSIQDGLRVWVKLAIWYTVYEIDVINMSCILYIYIVYTYRYWYYFSHTEIYLIPVWWWMVAQDSMCFNVIYIQSFSTVRGTDIPSRQGSWANVTASHEHGFLGRRTRGCHFFNKILGGVGCQALGQPLWRHARTLGEQSI